MKIHNKRIRKLSIKENISIEDAKLKINNSRTGEHDEKRHKSKAKNK